jgi:hypothetical protein
MMVEIDSNTYNALVNALKVHKNREEVRGFNYRYPFLFLLASKEGDIICKIQRVQENTGCGYTKYGKPVENCYRMSSLGAKEFSIAAVDLMKKEYIVRGLARVGNFNRGGHHQDGIGIEELCDMNPELLFLSLEPTALTIIKVGDNKNQPYKIVYKEPNVRRILGFRF